MRPPCLVTIFRAVLRGRRLFREVQDWIESGDNEPFSFQHICDVLGIDPAYLREGLERWRERESAAAPARVGSPAGARRPLHERARRSARRPRTAARPMLLRRATVN